MESWQEEQFQLLLSAQTSDELFKSLSATTQELGFEHCAYGMRAPLPISNPKVFLINDYPTQWQECYVNNNYLLVDPTVAHGMKSVLPLIWSEEVFSSCRQFWEEARSHKLKIGWAQSCHDARGVGGLLTLSRSHDELSPAELKVNTHKMSWLTQIAHEGFSNLLAYQLLPDLEPLTKREAEVLRWTADGKTSSEIGEIINISESTVNFHINNAVNKLGATNKTAASIKAVALRLL